MTQSVNVSSAAHTKMILHACRNGNSQVHGVLIGSFQSSGGGGGSGPVLTLADAIPVFHSSPTKPILDMALRLIEAQIGGKDSDLGIVGWYSANERVGDDDRPGQAALRIVGGLASGLEAMGKSLPIHAEPVAVLVSNKGTIQLLQDEGGDDSGGGVGGLKVFGRDSRKHWLRPYGPDDIECTSGGVARSACIQDSQGVPIFDFEDHMDGGTEHLGTRDWLTNAVVSNFVKKA